MSRFHEHFVRRRPGQWAPTANCSLRGFCWAFTAAAVWTTTGRVLLRGESSTERERERQVSFRNLIWGQSKQAQIKGERSLVLQERDHSSGADVRYAGRESQPITRRLLASPAPPTQLAIRSPSLSSRPRWSFCYWQTPFSRRCTGSDSARV